MMKSLTQRMIRAPYHLARRAWQRLALGNVAIPLDCGVVVRGDLRHKSWRRTARQGFHEPATDRFLADFLRRGDCVLDIGAHIGILTAIAAQQVGEEGIVVAVDVDAENFAQLKATVRRNRFTNVLCRKQALGSVKGYAEFVRPSDSWGSFAANSPIPHIGDDDASALGREIRRSAATERFTASSTTIDELVQREKLVRVDVIKIDVDGCEFSILQGAEQTLRQFRPMLVYEDSQYSRDLGVNFAQVFDLFSAHDYELYGCIREADDLWPVTTSGEPWVEQLVAAGQDVNLFCRPREKFADRWQQLWFHANPLVADPL